MTCPSYVPKNYKPLTADESALLSLNNLDWANRIGCMNEVRQILIHGKVITPCPCGMKPKILAEGEKTEVEKFLIARGEKQ
jgi:hypothetical protein